MPEDHPDPPPADAAGESVVFGHFTVPRRPDGGLWELGRGAMGVTYLAFDTSLRTEVALKVTHADKVADERARRRFQREARAAAALAHPNVARVLYLGEQGGEFFYAMEFVAGRSLEELLRETAGPLPPAVAVALAAQATAGLSAAHKREVLHRDLKPANLMLLEGDAVDHDDRRVQAAGHRQLKVIDFGLARAFGERRVEESHVTQTVAGGFIGTPLYASPEQCREEETIDGRSDLYSLGIILWEMLVGAPPFSGKTISVLAKHIDTPPPRECLEHLPAPLPDLLAGLLEKDPNTRRPQTAGELRGELDEVLRALLVPPPRAPRPPMPVPVEPAFAAPLPMIEPSRALVPSPVPVVRSPRRWLFWVVGLFLSGVATVLAAMFWMTGQVERGQAVFTPEPTLAPTQEPMPVPTPVPTLTSTAPEPDQNFRNAAGAEMVWIVPGTFTMGSPASERGHNSDETPHQVTLTRGYWMGKYKVTQAFYEQVIGANPSRFKEVGPDAPVEKVSWDDAKAFCDKLNEREPAAGRLPTGYRYGLPTEAQWEYSCRAGMSGAAYYGAALDSIAWYNRNSGLRTHPVGHKAPNAFGLYDTIGNVWEWCGDCYGSYSAGSVTDPNGPARGSSGVHRVNRGGSWLDDPGYCRAADRGRNSPGYRIDNLGFRLALGRVHG